MRDIIAERLLQLLATSIGISGILVAIDTFNAKSSLLIKPEERVGIEYYPNRWIDFYKNLDIPVPGAVKKVITQFNEKRKRFNLHGLEYLDAASDTSIIKGLKNVDTDEWDDYIKLRTLSLNEVISKPVNTPYVFGYGNSGYIDVKGIEKLQEQFKKILSTLEYYHFLSASINSRLIRQRFLIKNDGELDLRNIKIFLPAPLVSTTHSRIGNIESIINIWPNNFVQMNSDEISYEINVSNLNASKTIPLTVVTRESQLAVEEIAISFEAITKVNFAKLIIFWITSFCVLLLLMWYLLENKTEEIK